MAQKGIEKYAIVSFKQGWKHVGDIKFKPKKQGKAGTVLEVWVQNLCVEDGGPKYIKVPLKMVMTK